MKNINEFSTLDIVKALKISRERLRSWMDANFIKPTRPASGQGSRAIFTLADVYGIALFKDLIDRGFNRKVASGLLHGVFVDNSIVDNISYILFRSKSRPDPGEKELIMVFPKGSWIIDIASGVVTEGKSKDALNANDDWRQILIINFEAIKQRVDEALLTI